VSERERDRERERERERETGKEKNVTQVRYEIVYFCLFDAYVAIHSDCNLYNKIISAKTTMFKMRNRHKSV